MTLEPTVVVTGVGLLCALGDDPATVWSELLDGSVGIGELSRFDTTGLTTTRGAEVPSRLTRPPADVRADRGTFVAEWAARAATMAVADAGLDEASVPSTRAGVCIGSVLATRGALDGWVTQGRADDERDFARHWTGPSALSRLTADRLGFAGPNCVIATACAASNSAIARGAQALRADRADVMVVGGAEEISRSALLVFDALRALSPDCVRPFDLRRRGLVLGEGAAALVLEREDDARARGARVYGRVLGHANVGEGHHMTSPHPEGRGAARAMTMALANAGLEAGDVDHVSAHGTGTLANDAAEASAIRQVFGPDAARLPVTAVKSMLGHTQGAAAAAEAIACLWAMRDSAIPPTANVEAADPSFEIDLVVGEARRQRVDVALSNAFGFGGNVECVVLGAP